jgi:hypothetical protein
MKSLLILLVFTFNIVSAQDSLSVSEIHDAISVGYQPGYSVYIPMTDAKELTSAWKKHLKNDGKADISEKKNEIITSKCIIPDISSDSIVLYSKLTPAENNSGTNLNVFVMAGRSSFISSEESPAIDKSIRHYLKMFATEQYRNAVVNQLTTEQRKLDVLKEDLRKLERENENCIKKINSAHKNNEGILEKISANAELLGTKSAEVDQQSEAVKDGAASDQKMDDEKKLKSLQKEKDQLKEEDESLHKQLDKNNSLIEDMQKKSDLNNSSNIPVKKEQIEYQKEVVSNLSKKLNSIR